MKSKKEKNNDDIVLDEEFLIYQEFSDESDDIMSAMDCDDDDYDKNFKLKANKHKIGGTHQLERDILLKGKDYQSESLDGDYLLDTEYEVDLTQKLNEQKLDEQYDYDKQLKKDVYNILKNYTDYNFDKNRRIPPKEVFNRYYKAIVEKLHNKYSKCDLVVEYSGYFTEELSNTVKYLNKEYMNDIIIEMKSKGKLSFLNDENGIKFLK